MRESVTSPVIARRRRPIVGAVLSALAVLGLPDATVGADDLLMSADKRFARQTAEVPHFQRHVLPLLRKLGCSGRNCHGAASGQGGFRLSLFGYDFEVDHRTLLEGDDPRVNVGDPAASLILKKPTMQVDHGGGERFALNSWQYELIEKWIEGGAAPVDLEDPQFQDLQTEPSEIYDSTISKTHAVRATSEWSNGSREDVTPLCHFEVLDESVATVDGDGVVTIRGPGDTHLIAFYDNGIASTPITIAGAEVTNADFPPLEMHTEIDKRIAAKLKKMGIVPSELCSDEEFLRRVSLDITGALPYPDDVRAFLDDTSVDKRSRKIDELLDSRGYAAYWAYKLSEIWGNKANDLRENLARPAQQYHWNRWLGDRLARNVPYDEIVEDMVVANSRLPDETYDDYIVRIGDIYRDDSHYAPRKDETLPYFWFRFSTFKDEDAAMAFSHAFLGVRLQCAQCHKHPFDVWTNADFRHFASYFSRINHDYQPDDKESASSMRATLRKQNVQDQLQMVRSGKRFPFREIVITPSLNKKLDENRQSSKYVARQLPIVKKQLAAARIKGDTKAIERAEEQLQKFNRARLIELEELIERTKRAVKEDHPILLEYMAKAESLRRELQGLHTTKIFSGFPADPEAVPDPRVILMNWLKSPDNRYFARIFVNRVWAGYFGRGIIEPVDDLNLANPPVNAPLLDYLTESFIERDYDIRWLHREIANSRAYQRSWVPNATNRDDERNFSRAIPRRLPAEVLESSLARVFAADDKTADRDVAEFKITREDYYERLRYNTFLESFGRPTGKPNLCDCDRSNEPALVQTLFMQNDTMINRMLNNSEWLSDFDQHASSRRRDDWITEAYLRTFSRFPSESEIAECREHIDAAQSPKIGMQDLLWALINSKEFQLNH